jgi:RimJ/RimL family protein N-acetyltransferase
MSAALVTPKGEVNIRLAVPQDAASLLELRLEALSMHPEAFAADVAMTAAEGAEVWSERIANNARDQSGAISIACAGDTLVGMAGIGRGHWPKTRHSGLIWGVYVNSDWRGLRLGDALLDQCIAWGQANGVVVVKLGVITTNTSAIRCYARSGFTVYGLDPRSNFYNGVYYDELLMAKLL